VAVDDLVRNPGAWLSMERDTGIVISSRVRLARNVKGALFPGWAGEEESVRLYRDVLKALQRVSSVVDPVFLDMAGLDPVDREVLKERHLISHEFAEKGAGSGLVVSGDEDIAIMINEEDHIRLQSISPGMNLPGVWEKINTVDSELEDYLEYAFSPRLGYLTACPSNVGTGLRTSAMMHLCGLKLMNEIEPVIRGLDKIGFTVRGLQGEGTEAYGNMFQVSNQITMGEKEEAIIERLVEVVRQVTRYEQNARTRLMEGKKTFVLDQIGRAFGVLLHAQALSSREAVDLLSGLRLGVEFGIVRNLTVTGVNEIMLLTQPGHLQKMAKKALDPEERDEVRASIVREKLKNTAISV